MTDPAAPRTFADHVNAYIEAGWSCPIPVPPETKQPPPNGFTGANGADPSPEQLAQWAAVKGAYSIALRMPDDVIGIDVDQYVKAGKQKHGAQTLAAYVERWGPLPATWSSTARGSAAGPGESRIMLFRVPAQRYVTKLDTGTTSDIEIIQRHHRYAVVWPSAHHDAGAPYLWFDPQGWPSPAPPKPSELAELPPTWVAGLAEGASQQSAASADVGSGRDLLDQLLEDWRPECADITSARLTAVDELSRADAGSRHDTMTGRVHQLVQLAAAGHSGVAHALLELRDLWANLTAGEDRADELTNMLVSSARKAVTTVGLVQVPNDPCLLMGGFVAPASAPDDNRPPAPEDPAHPEAPVEGIEPGRWYSVREAVGAHAFDPNANLDQTLAEAVLQRMYPAMRYAYDANTWLIRVPDRWEARGKDLAGWAVAQLAPLMPHGDPSAEKGSDQHARDKRRSRMMTNAGARGVAGKIESLVKGGTHPASVRLGSLDSDPEILWAGGMPYSLRLSADGPTFANINPATPHLHSAGVPPEIRDTPLWDAFLEAVWPDPKLRAWAVRVLSIALTGYADRAMPILLGDTARGKTQVIHLLMSVLGSYAHAANPKLLSSAQHEHDTIIYALKGRRLSFIDEAPSEAKAGQERLKQLTGGGELTARQMNQDPITFSPSHTLVLTANDEPVLTDPAIRSRVRLIPCEGDPELVRATRAAIGGVSGPDWRREAPGVLAKMMSEASGWLADPLTGSTLSAPESVRYLAESMGAEQDPVAVWITEETEWFEEGTPSRELYQAFVASCRRNSMRMDAIPSETRWGRALTRFGIPSVHSHTSKRRPIRVRQGGFNPPTTLVTGSPAVMTPTRQPSPPGADAPSTAVPIGDGLTPVGDGLVTGSEGNPSPVYPQVNPSVSVDGDGLTGLERDLRTHTPTRTHARDDYQTPPNPSPDPSGEQPAKAKKATKPRSAEATAKAAAARAEKRVAAVAEAGGQRFDLPAAVTRDGTVLGVDLATVAAMLATITGPGGAGVLTVDVETTGYPVGHELHQLRTVQLGDEEIAFVLDPAISEHAELASRHLAAATWLHAHSATADLVPLAALGLVEADEAWAKMLDTGILAKLADPASTGNDADLKNLSKAVLGEHALSHRADEARKALFRAGGWLTDTEVTTPIERSGWAQADPHSATMIVYAASDVLDDAAIARRMPMPPPEILNRERMAQRMTARIAHRGIRINGEQVDRLLEEHTTAREQHAELVRAFGVENPGSGPQVAAALEALGVHLPRTATGKPSVAAGVIEPMRHAEGQVGDLARAVLDYRHHNTALGLFLEPYRELVHRGDGRARPTVYTLGAKTGRMSCVRPNLQQVSREGGLRACFTADPGQLLISADFSSVELRVAAALSQDPDLISMLLEGRDLHGEVAKLTFGPEATKAHRYRIKRGVFGRIYGGGVPAVAAGVGVSHPQAQQIIDTMDQLTPGLTAWSARMRYQVESGHLHFSAYSGRVIHLPKGTPHAAPNYCIQGTARELLIDALERWSVTPWGDATLFPVHDEVVALVPEDQAAEATAALAECMVTSLSGVPIVSDPSEPSFYWKDSA